MDREYDHKRAVGDILSPFATQIVREGIPVNLTGFTAKFSMINRLTGAVKVDQQDMDISNAALGWVDYDFDVSEVNVAGDYKGFITVYGSGEPDTYPANEDGISILLYETEVADETIPDGIDPDTFKDLATAPRRTRTVEGTVEERSIDDLIKADRYMKQSSNEGIPWGIRVARTKPPGTCS